MKNVRTIGIFTKLISVFLTLLLIFYIIPSTVYAEVVGAFSISAEENEQINELRKYIENKVVEIDETLSVHDVRVVYGIDRNIVIFDMVVPFSCTTDDKLLKEQITLKIKEKYPSWDTNITIDKSYE